MAIALTASQLPQRIQELLEDRQQHADAVAHIDQLLANVGAVLGNGAVITPNGKKPVAAPAATMAPAVKGKKRRRGRGNFALSAEDSILMFVKQKKNPTTAEVNQHVKDEGRASTADNTLSIMVKKKKLKRTPLGGRLGSRYTVA